MLPPTTDNAGGYVKQNLQKGSATVIAVALVLLIGVAAAGWFVWSKNSDRPKDNVSQQTHKTADPSEGGKYLVIKEWGVRFPLPEDLRGEVEYGVFTFNDGSEAAYFTSKGIAAKSLDGGCDLRETNDSTGHGMSGGTIAINRATVKSSEPGAGEFQGPGGNWYHVEASNGGECYPGDTGEEKGRLNGGLDEAFQHLEAIRSE